MVSDNFGAECSAVTEAENTHVYALLLKHLKGVDFLVAMKNQRKLRGIYDNGHVLCGLLRLRQKQREKSDWELGVRVSHCSPATQKKSKKTEREFPLLKSIYFKLNFSLFSFLSFPFLIFWFYLESLIF